MNDNNIYYIIDSFASILVSPRWEAEVLSFVDEKCIVFDSEEENKLLFTAVHKEFVDLVDEVLADRLSECGISEEQFDEACLKYNSRCKKSKKILDNGVIDQIHAMADFQGFKTMMLKRNMELQIEAMEALQKIDGSCRELRKDIINELMASHGISTSSMKTTIFGKKEYGDSDHAKDKVLKSLEISGTLVVEDPSDTKSILIGNNSLSEKQQLTKTMNDIQSSERSQGHGSGNKEFLEDPKRKEKSPEESRACDYISTDESVAFEVIEQHVMINHNIVNTAKMELQDEKLQVVKSEMESNSNDKKISRENNEDMPAGTTHSSHCRKINGQQTSGTCILELPKEMVRLIQHHAGWFLLNIFTLP